MSTPDLLRFVSLAALFSLSFLFMRVAAPHFGAIVTAELRVLIAGVLLTALTLATGREMGTRRDWRAFLVAGGLNTAIPFALFAYAAMHIPAGYSAILNSLMPIWAAFFAAFMLGGFALVALAAGLVLGIGPFRALS